MNGPQVLRFVAGAVAICGRPVDFRGGVFVH